MFKKDGAPEPASVEDPICFRKAVDVCSWHLADIDFGTKHVRLRVQSGRPPVGF